MRVTKEDIKYMLAIDKDLGAFENLERLELEYEILEGDERDKAILGCIKRIVSDTKIVGTPERTKVWEKGWAENLEDFMNSDDVNSLLPKHYHSGEVMRYLGDFIVSDHNDFQIKLDLFLKRCLFEIYASDKKNVYEFGCGSGYNLVLCGDMYPEKKLFGMDITENSVRILNLLRENHGYDIDGKQFDFCHPNYEIGIEPDSAIFTYAALEQIGDKFQGFIDYLMDNIPEGTVVVHLEPIVELYDEDNLMDYLSLWFHNMRKYLSGLLPYLKELEGENRIIIEKIQRLHFGNHSNEGYTLVVWHIQN